MSLITSITSSSSTGSPAQNRRRSKPTSQMGHSSNMSTNKSNSNLHSLMGQKWKSFADKNTTVMEITKREENRRCKANVMRLDKTDMGLYGMYPETDPFCAVICALCSAVVKPQGMPKHMYNQHRQAVGMPMPSSRTKAILSGVRKSSPINHSESMSNKLSNTYGMSTTTSNDGDSTSSFTSSMAPPLAVTSTISSLSKSKIRSDNSTSNTKNKSKSGKSVSTSATITTSTSNTTNVNGIMIANTSATTKFGPAAVASITKSLDSYYNDTDNQLKQMTGAACMSLQQTTSGSAKGIIAPNTDSYNANEKLAVSSNGQQQSAGMGNSLLTKRNRNSTERKCLPIKDREYDPNKHCGVITGEPAKPCTRSLTCKSHALSLRRQVSGRNNTFDKLLSDHRAAKDTSNLNQPKNFPEIESSSNSSSSFDMNRRIHGNIHNSNQPIPLLTGNLRQTPDVSATSAMLGEALVSMTTANSVVTVIDVVAISNQSNTPESISHKLFGKEKRIEWDSDVEYISDTEEIMKSDRSFNINSMKPQNDKTYDSKFTIDILHKDSKLVSDSGKEKLGTVAGPENKYSHATSNKGKRSQEKQESKISKQKKVHERRKPVDILTTNIVNTNRLTDRNLISISPAAATFSELKSKVSLTDTKFLLDPKQKTVSVTLIGTLPNTEEPGITYLEGQAIEEDLLESFAPYGFRNNVGVQPQVAMPSHVDVPSNVNMLSHLGVSPHMGVPHHMNISPHLSMSPNLGIQPHIGIQSHLGMQQPQFSIPPDVPTSASLVHLFPPSKIDVNPQLRQPISPFEAHQPIFNTSAGSSNELINVVIKSELIDENNENKEEIGVQPKVKRFEAVKVENDINNLVKIEIKNEVDDNSEIDVTHVTDVRDQKTIAIVPLSPTISPIISVPEISISDLHISFNESNEVLVDIDALMGEPILTDMEEYQHYKYPIEKQKYLDDTEKMNQDDLIMNNINNDANVITIDDPILELNGMVNVVDSAIDKKPVTSYSISKNMRILAEIDTFMNETATDIDLVADIDGETLSIVDSDSDDSFNEICADYESIFGGKDWFNTVLSSEMDSQPLAENIEEEQLINGGIINADQPLEKENALQRQFRKVANHIDDFRFIRNWHGSVPKPMNANQFGLGKVRGGTALRHDILTARKSYSAHEHMIDDMDLISAINRAVKCTNSTHDSSIRMDQNRVNGGFQLIRNNGNLVRTNHMINNSGGSNSASSSNLLSPRSIRRSTLRRKMETMLPPATNINGFSLDDILGAYRGFDNNSADNLVTGSNLQSNNHNTHTTTNGTHRSPKHNTSNHHSSIHNHHNNIKNNRSSNRSAAMTIHSSAYSQEQTSRRSSSSAVAGSYTNASSMFGGTTATTAITATNGQMTALTNNQISLQNRSRSIVKSINHNSRSNSTNPYE